MAPSRLASQIRRRSAASWLVTFVGALAIIGVAATVGCSSQALHPAQPSGAQAPDPAEFDDAGADDRLLEQDAALEPADARAHEATPPTSEAEAEPPVDSDRDDAAPPASPTGDAAPGVAQPSAGAQPDRVEAAADDESDRAAAKREREAAPSKSRPSQATDSPWADALGSATDEIAPAARARGAHDWVTARREPQRRIAPIVDTSSWRWLFATPVRERVGIDSLSQLLASPTPQPHPIAGPVGWGATFRSHPLDADRHVLALELVHVAGSPAPSSARTVPVVIVAQRPERWASAVIRLAAAAPTATMLLLEPSGATWRVNASDDRKVAAATSPRAATTWQHLDAAIDAHANTSMLVISDGQPLRTADAITRTAARARDRNVTLTIIDVGDSRHATAGLHDLARRSGGSLLDVSALDDRTTALRIAGDDLGRQVSVELELDDAIVRRHRLVGYEALPGQAGRLGAKLRGGSLAPGQRMIVLVELELTRRARRDARTRLDLGSLLVDVDGHAAGRARLIAVRGNPDDPIGTLAAIATVLDGSDRINADDRQRLRSNVQRAVSSGDIDARLLAPALAWLDGGAP